MLMNAYPWMLVLHSLWRWVVLLSAVTAIGAAIVGLAGKRPFRPLGRVASMSYVGALDLQLLLGLFLYAASPLVRVAWQNMAAAMKQKELRFFSVEHLTAMFIAVILAHIGSVRCRRGPDDQTNYRRMLLWYSLSLIAMLAGVPWWRPLARWFQG